MQDGLIQLPDITQEALLLLNRLLYKQNHLNLYKRNFRIKSIRKRSTKVSRNRVGSLD